MLNEAERDDGSQSYSAVENYTLSYYKEMGFPNGVHAEGSSYTFIFTLIFWDIIFMDVDDVFLGPYQVQVKFYSIWYSQICLTMVGQI